MRSRREAEEAPVGIEAEAAEEIPPVSQPVLRRLHGPNACMGLPPTGPVAINGTNGLNKHETSHIDESSVSRQTTHFPAHAPRDRRAAERPPPPGGGGSAAVRLPGLADASAGAALFLEDVGAARRRGGTSVDRGTGTNSGEDDAQRSKAKKRRGLGSYGGDQRCGDDVDHECGMATGAAAAKDDCASSLRGEASDDRAGAGELLPAVGAGRRRLRGKQAAAAGSATCGVANSVHMEFSGCPSRSFTSSLHRCSVHERDGQPLIAGCGRPPDLGGRHVASG